MDKKMRGWRNCSLTETEDIINCLGNEKNTHPCLQKIDDDVYQWLCESYTFFGKRERKSVPDAEEKKRTVKVR